MALLFAVTTLANPSINDQMPSPDAVEQLSVEQCDEAYCSHTGFVNDEDNDESEGSDKKDNQLQAEEPDYESNIDIKFAAAPALAGLLILSSMFFD